MKPDLRGRRAWRVRIAAHTVGGRHELPASERLRFERSRGAAIAEAIRSAHIDARVPPWRPFLRESVPHVSVSETWWNPVDG